MSIKIPYGRQDIDDADIASVVEALRSDFLTQGPRVTSFENAFAQTVTAEHAVAANSATSALHIAYLALGVGPGDIVWTSPVTFVATSNAALMCGASVDFVDIDEETFCIDPIRLEEKLVEAAKVGRLPKLVVPVHLTGRSCDMAAIKNLSARYGFKIVEDASHAVGASYNSRPVGCCEWSDIAIFSFHPVKIITAAEGGMATTNDAEIAQRMREFASHGITRDLDRMQVPPEGDWFYSQIALGLNYRMSDLHAALGISQLARVDQFIARRRELVRRYNEQLSALPIALPDATAIDESSWHLYVIRTLSGNRRADVFARLRDRGIGVQVHYIPVHVQPFYMRMGFSRGDFPVAEDYYARAISIPLFPALSDAEQDEVVAALSDILDE